MNILFVIGKYDFVAADDGCSDAPEFE